MNLQIKFGTSYREVDSYYPEYWIYIHMSGSKTAHIDNTLNHYSRGHGLRDKLIERLTKSCR